MWFKLGGAYIWLEEDERRGVVELKRVVDPSPLYLANKDLRQAQGKGNMKGWRLKARIPIDLLMTLPYEERLAILYDDKALDRFLAKHPELMTVEGKP
ncbi:MAG: hypothetical protein QXT86_12485 [Archaeoglobaceae archaeon]